MPETVAPWSSTNVTLLGDAIHTMTPLQGLGGNMALRDASVLSHKLTSHDDPLIAVAAYEAEMRDYAFRALRQSLRYTEVFASRSRLRRAGFKGFLLAADRIAPLKRRMFAEAA